MTRTLYFSVYVVLQIIIVQTNGQDCIPQEVQNIVLYDDHTLSWSPSSTEVCAISHYSISIMGDSNYEELIFISEETVLDVGYLSQCEAVWITITAISTQNVEGVRKFHYAKTSAPPEANLNLTFLRVSSYSLGGVWLEWDVADEWLRCAREYRLVVYNEDYDDIQFSTYVPYPYARVNDISPCTTYIFTVTALYNLETEGHVTVMRYAAPKSKISPPTLQRMTVGRTTADFTWVMEGHTINNCPVNALIVDGSPNFNISYPITDQNQISRPPIDVHLTDLQPDTMYILYVSANNTAGLSEPFIVAMQTLE